MTTFAALARHRRGSLLLALLTALALVPAGAGAPPSAEGMAVAAFGPIAPDTSAQGISVGRVSPSSARAELAAAVLPAVAGAALPDGGEVAATTAAVNPVSRGAGALAAASSGDRVVAALGSAEASDAWLVATGSGAGSAALAARPSPSWVCTPAPTQYASSPTIAE
jgi:hypothetical protein